MRLITALNELVEYHDQLRGFALATKDSVLDNQRAEEIVNRIYKAAHVSPDPFDSVEKGGAWELFKEKARMYQNEVEWRNKAWAKQVEQTPQVEDQRHVDGGKSQKPKKKVTFEEVQETIPDTAQSKDTVQDMGVGQFEDSTVAEDANEDTEGKIVERLWTKLEAKYGFKKPQSSESHSKDTLHTSNEDTYSTTADYDESEPNDDDLDKGLSDQEFVFNLPTPARKMEFDINVMELEHDLEEVSARVCMYCGHERARAYNGRAGGEKGGAVPQGKGKGKETVWVELN